MTWFVPPRPAPEIEPALQRLADAEVAARSAWDRAMIERAPIDRLERLRAIWTAANDRLADAIRERDRGRQ